MRAFRSEFGAPGSESEERSDSLSLGPSLPFADRAGGFRSIGSVLRFFAPSPPTTWCHHAAWCHCVAACILPRLLLHGVTVLLRGVAAWCAVLLRGVTVLLHGVTVLLHVLLPSEYTPSPPTTWCHHAAWCAVRSAGAWLPAFSLDDSGYKKADEEAQTLYNSHAQQAIALHYF